MFFVYLKKAYLFILETLSVENPIRRKLEQCSEEFWFSIYQETKLTPFTLYFFPYRNKFVREAVLAIKSERNIEILRKILDPIVHNLPEILSEYHTWYGFKPTVIIAIPATNTTKGFNHSEDIASLIATMNPSIEFKHIKRALLKIKHTPLQHTQNRENRIKQIKHSMQVKDKSYVEGKDILLIDDVTTTGATFEEGVRALLEAGARKVLCIALAH